MHITIYGYLMNITIYGYLMKIKTDWLNQYMYITTNQNSQGVGFSIQNLSEECLREEFTEQSQKCEASKKTRIAAQQGSKETVWVQKVQQKRVRKQKRSEHGQEQESLKQDNLIIFCDVEANVFSLVSKDMLDQGWAQGKSE